MKDTPSPASDDVANKRCRCYGNGASEHSAPPLHRGDVAALPTVTTRDTSVDSDNRQQAVGSRQRYKKPAEQYVKLVCD
jgi:hypothetical protein